MRRICWGICLLVAMASCGGNNRAKSDPFAPLTEMVDSAAAPHHRGDTLPEELPEEEPHPIEADELFDDFMFSFASDEALQKQRVKFPLSYYDVDTPRKVEKGDWTHEDLFDGQSYYTLFFDYEEDMDLVGDTTLTSVQMEWIYLKERMVKKYYFERTKGVWMLEAINKHPLAEEENGNFIDFYMHFAADSLFQGKHISQPLQFVTIDPDDEFSILETVLDANQWFAFRPSMPSEQLSNINYGQRNSDQSRNKILKVNGIGNGYSNLFYFRKRNGRWELYKFEDTGM